MTTAKRKSLTGQIKFAEVRICFLRGLRNGFRKKLVLRRFVTGIRRIQQQDQVADKAGLRLPGS